MPDDTTTPVAAEGGEHANKLASSHASEHGVAAEGLRERVDNAIAFHLGYRSSRATDAVMAELVGDPGDLPARTAEAFKSAAYVCPGDDCPLSDEECNGQHPITLVAVSKPVDGPELTFIEGTTVALAEVAMGVRDEHLAATLAENAKLRADLDDALGNAQAYHEHMCQAQNDAARYRRGVEEATRRADLAEVGRGHWERRAGELQAERDAKLRTKALGRSLVEMEGFAQRETARADKAEAEIEQYRARLAARITEEAGLSWQELLDRAERLAGPHPTFEAFRLVDGQRLAAAQRAEAAEAQVAAISRDVVAVYGEDYGGEDVPAEVKRLLAHLAEHETNLGRVLGAKGEAIERAQGQVAALREELAEVKTGVAEAVRQIRAWQDPDSAEPLLDHVYVPEVERTLKAYIGEHVIAALEHRAADPEEIQRLAQATTEEKTAERTDHA